MCVYGQVGLKVSSHLNTLVLSSYMSCNTLIQYHSSSLSFLQIHKDTKVLHQHSQSQYCIFSALSLHEAIMLLTDSHFSSLRSFDNSFVVRLISFTTVLHFTFALENQNQYTSPFLSLTLQDCVKQSGLKGCCSLSGTSHHSSSSS